MIREITYKNLVDLNEQIKSKGIKREQIISMPLTGLSGYKSLFYWVD